MNNSENNLNQEINEQRSYRRFSPTSEALTYLGASATSFFISGVELAEGGYSASTIAFIAGISVGALGALQLKQL